MKRILSITFLMFACSFAAIAQCSDADKKALEAFDRAWGMAGEKGDKAALEALYADDFMALPFMTGKAAAIEGTMKAFEANKKNPNPDKVTHDHYHINCTANTATITHRNTIWTADGEGGKPEMFYTRSVHMLEKRGGKWLAVSNAGGGSMDDYGVLWYLEQDWNDAVWKKDTEWFKANFAEDFSSISSETGVLHNKASDIAGTASDKSSYDLVETTDMNINIDGKTARITGVFHLKGKDDKGKAFDTKIRYTDIWVKRDGRWVAWSSQGTIIK